MTILIDMYDREEIKIELILDSQGTVISTLKSFIHIYIYLIGWSTDLLPNYDTILILGGQRTLDPSSGEAIQFNGNKQQLPTLPQPIFSYPSMLLHNEMIMLCGGSNNMKTCLKPQEGTWTNYNSLKIERYNAAVASTNTATFIFGGWGSKDTYEYLEKNSSEWKLGKSKIPGGFSKGCSITISQDEIWLVGGRHTGKRILSFNVNYQTFTVLATKLKRGRTRHQCAIIPGTRHLLITGGFFYDFNDSTDIIDVENRRISEGPPMNAKRADHGIGVLNIDGQERVVVFGGCSHQGVYPKIVELYNAQAPKWEPTNVELGVGRIEFGFMTIKSQP